MTVEAGAAQTMRVATFYYPYWNARVNGQTVDVQMDNFGAIQIPLLPERSNVEITFNEPDTYAIANWLSLLTWIGLALGIPATLWRRVTEL